MGPQPGHNGNGGAVMASDVDTDQSGSDPMPYAQVDRAVKQTAAMIGTRLGVTYQHALGGLVQFWELNGDPRELETLLEAGKHEVVVTRDVVARRFSLAMSVDTSKVDPDDLHELRIVERREDGYRIRGMSRYFKPLVTRVAKRLAGRAGGQKSAEARAKKHGSAQPGASAAASGAASVGASKQTDVTFDSASRSAQAPPNTADSVQRSSLETTYVRAPAASSTASSVVIPPTTPAEQWLAEDFWRWAQATRQDAKLVAEKFPNPVKLSGWFTTALQALNGDTARLCEAFLAFGDDKYWQRQSPPLPFAGFMSQWERFVGAADAAS